MNNRNLRVEPPDMHQNETHKPIRRKNGSYTYRGQIIHPYPLTRCMWKFDCALAIRLKKWTGHKNGERLLTRERRLTIRRRIELINDKITPVVVFLSACAGLWLACLGWGYVFSHASNSSNSDPAMGVLGGGLLILILSLGFIWIFVAIVCTLLLTLPVKILSFLHDYQFNDARSTDIDRVVEFIRDDLCMSIYLGR